MNAMKKKFSINSAPLRKAPRVKLHPNVNKVVAAICYLIAKAASEKKFSEITHYQILKSIFLADKSHLNAYGRPVTFDNYVAMKDGPVASLTYSLLKEERSTLNRHHIKKVPWDKKNAANNRMLFSNANPKDLDDILSVSDKDALHGALCTIKSLTYAQTKKLLHEDASYIEAWDGSRRSTPMSFGMMFDTPDFDAAERVAFLSCQT